MKPGSGRVDLGIFGTGSIDSGRAGAFLDAEARLNKSLSVFGRGEASAGWGTERDLEWAALAGLRLRF